MNRREFLQNSAAVSTALNLQLAGSAAADSLGVGSDRKTLVCIYFGGGLDSYHVLIPTDSDRFDVYDRSRGNIARDFDSLHPLSEDGGPTIIGETYGLAGPCEELADMFNGTGDFAGKRRASWVTNVGSLINPLDKEAFLAGTPGIDIPVGVGGHARQSEQWQTTLPQGTVDLKGWMGRAADLLRDGFNRDRTSMNLSLGGNNLMQLGKVARPVAFTPFSNFGLTGDASTTGALALKNAMHREIMSFGHDDYVRKTFAEISGNSLGEQTAIQNALITFDNSRIQHSFGSSIFEARMEMVLKLIAERETMGLCRQTFFVPAIGGWDDHFELGQKFEERMTAMSRGIATFQRNLEEMGLAEGVIGFTASEFARTLRSTGQGSDHAWGGPQMVFGEPIEGGRIFGEFPNQDINDRDNPDDVGRGGRIIPTIACDEYYGEMLKWFGVEDNRLTDVLPNYDNFRIDGRPTLSYITA